MNVLVDRGKLPALEKVEEVHPGSRGTCILLLRGWVICQETDPIQTDPTQAGLTDLPFYLALKQVYME